MTLRHVKENAMDQPKWFSKAFVGRTYKFKHLIRINPDAQIGYAAVFTQINTNAFLNSRDVTIGATGATPVAPKFSDTLTLSQPRGTDFAHHRRGRS